MAPDAARNFLSTGDWIVIAVYLVGIIIFGVVLGRGQKDTKSYFLGNKNISWWGVSLSILATETSALTFISIPAIAYGGAMFFIQIVIGYVIARIILAIVMVPHYFKGEIYSPYQLFSQAFGPSARQVAGIFFLIAGTLAAGVRVYVTCIPLDLIMGKQLAALAFGDAILGAILLFVVLSLIYTYIGGIKAVIWTDVIQFVLLIGGGLFTIFYIPSLLGGGFSGAMAQAAEAGKLQWLNTDFSHKMPINIWMGLIGATVMVMATHGADQLIVQRVLTCKSVADGRKALALSAVIILPLFLIFLIAGVLLWVFYTQFQMAIPLPEAHSRFSKNDYIFPIFIVTEMPPIVKGFIIVAIFSAAMSSVSSALSALSSVSTMDLFKSWSKKERSEKFYFSLSRFSTIFWGVMLIFVAYFSQNVEFLLNWAFKLNGLTNGAMLGGLALALYWKRGRATPVISGMFTSLVCMIALSNTTEIAWPWFTLIGSTITILVASVVRKILPAQPVPATVGQPDADRVLPN